MILNIKFHEVLFINSWTTLATKFLSLTHTDTQTDWHFPEIVKSCSGHPKTCKSIKNRKSKICTKPILSSIYIEESRKHSKLIFFLRRHLKDFECWKTSLFQSISLFARSTSPRLNKVSFPVFWRLWWSRNIQYYSPIIQKYNPFKQA